MNHGDIKLAAINGSTMLLSFSSIEYALKIVLLLFSIAYTAYKIYELHEGRKAKKNS